MFAVLTLGERKLKKYSLSIEQAGRQQYLHITLHRALSRRAARRLRRRVSGLASHTLLPRGVQNEWQLSEFDPADFYTTVLFSTARELIRRAAVGRQHRFCCCVLDAQQRYVNHTATLIDCCGVLKVVCDEPFEYRRLSEQLLRLHGGGLVLTHRSGECELLIDPAQRSLFVGGRQLVLHPAAITRYRGLLRERPHGIEPMDFLALLAASSGTPLGCPVAETLLCEGEPITPAAAAAIVQASYR